MSSIDPRIDKVKNIIETELSDEIVETFIEGAETFLDSVLTGKTLSVSLREQVELWLTAHMLAISREKNQSAIDMGAGGAYIKYSDAFGQGLLQTTYGQMAIALDATKTLEKLVTQKGTPKFKAISNDTYK